MKNEILLVSVNSKKELYAATANNYAAIQPNIYMGLLDSYLNSVNVPTDMINAEAQNLKDGGLLDIIEQRQPLLVVVVCSGSNPSASTMSMVSAIRFINKLKTKLPHQKVAVYGGHPSVLPQRTLDETKADFVIIGEGFKTLEQLYLVLNRQALMGSVDGIALYSGKEYYFRPAPDLIDVNKLPMVNWDKLGPNRYRAHNWQCLGDLDKRSPYGVVWTSFGCPYACDFCCINNLFGGSSYRLRDMKSVVDEIGVLVSKGVKYIKIMDELFVTKHPRIKEFCDLLEERKYPISMWCFARVDSVDEDILARLKSIGMDWIAYGFESVTPKILRKMNKKTNLELYEKVIKWTKDAGINIIADVVAGFEDDDYDTLQDTYDFLCKHNFEFINLYPAFAFPGTVLYERMLDKGWIEKDKKWTDYELFGYNCKPLSTNHLSAKEVLAWRDKAYVYYINRPEYLQMIEHKFGVDAKCHILNMITDPIERKLLT